MFRPFLSSSRLLVAAAAVVLARPGAAQEMGSRTYTNARFGYSLQYPSALLVAKPEADNGDGRRFESRDRKVLLRAFGSYNINNQSIGSKLQSVSADWKADGAQVTYQKSGEGWYAVSGFVGGDIFYEKALLRNGTFATIIWEYPKSYRERLDAAVTRSVRSFRLGKVTYSTPSTARPTRTAVPSHKTVAVPRKVALRPVESIKRRADKPTEKVAAKQAPAPTHSPATAPPPRATTSRGY